MILLSLKLIFHSLHFLECLLWFSSNYFVWCPLILHRQKLNCAFCTKVKNPRIAEASLLAYFRPGMLLLLPDKNEINDIENFSRKTSTGCCSYDFVCACIFSYYVVWRFSFCSCWARLLDFCFSWAKQLLLFLSHCLVARLYVKLPCLSALLLLVTQSNEKLLIELIFR